ncbi:hypothetical protein YC2023_061401 [Brassica napus]
MTVTPRPPTANGSPTPALSARGPHPIRRSVTHPSTTPAQARLTLEFFQDVLRKRSQDASQVTHPSTTPAQARLTLEFFQDVLRKRLSHYQSKSLIRQSAMSTDGKLADVVKHFSAKYGKDFVSAAVGLQSDSGVSRLLVDKLSVKAPDGPTKNKILKEIATKHNVTWEPESLVEPDPKETSGASSSQSVSGINSYSSRIQTINLQSFKLHLLLTWSRTYMKLAEYLPAALLLLITIVKIQDFLEIRMVAENTDPHPAAESAERVSFAARAAAELSSKERMRMTMQSFT